MGAEESADDAHPDALIGRRRGGERGGGMPVLHDAADEAAVARLEFEVVLAVIGQMERLAHADRRREPLRIGVLVVAGDQGVQAGGVAAAAGLELGLVGIGDRQLRHAQRQLGGDAGRIQPQRRLELGLGRMGLAAILEHLTKIEPHARVMRRQFRGPAMADERLLRVVQGLHQVAEVGPGVGEVGRQLQGVEIDARGLLQPAERLQRIGDVVVRPRRAGLQRQHLAEPLAGLARLPLAHEGDAEPRQRRGVGRVRVEGPQIRLLGLLQLLGGGEHVPEPREGAVVGRLDLERALQGDPGLVSAAEPQEQAAQVGVGSRRGRIGRDRASDELSRFGRTALARAQDPEVVQRQRMVGPNRQEGLVEDGGLLHLAFAVQGEGPVEQALAVGGDWNGGFGDFGLRTGGHGTVPSGSAPRSGASSSDLVNGSRRGRPPPIIFACPGPPC